LSGNLERNLGKGGLAGTETGEAQPKRSRERKAVNWIPKKKRERHFLGKGGYERNRAALERKRASWYLEKSEGTFDMI